MKTIIEIKIGQYLSITDTVYRATPSSGLEIVGFSKKKINYYSGQNEIITINKNTSFHIEGSDIILHIDTEFQPTKTIA